MSGLFALKKPHNPHENVSYTDKDRKYIRLSPNFIINIHEDPTKSLICMKCNYILWDPIRNTSAKCSKFNSYMCLHCFNSLAPYSVETDKKEFKCVFCKQVTCRIDIEKYKRIKFTWGEENDIKRSLKKLLIMCPKGCKQTVIYEEFWDHMEDTCKFSGDYLHTYTNKNMYDDIILKQIEKNYPIMMFGRKNRCEKDNEELREKERELGELKKKEKELEGKIKLLEKEVKELNEYKLKFDNNDKSKELDNKASNNINSKEIKEEATEVIQILEDEKEIINKKKEVIEVIEILEYEI